jgi:hypothetical protein
MKERWLVSSSLRLVVGVVFIIVWDESTSRDNGSFDKLSPLPASMNVAAMNGIERLREQR